MMDNALNNNAVVSDQRRLHEVESEYQTIGQMGSRYSVSLRTLRFYEDRGLLSPLRHGTTRLYDRRQRARVEMILKGKRLGFTLTEIRQMLGTRAREAPAEIESALAQDKIEAQINLLERQRKVLDVAIDELRATHQRMGLRSDDSPRAAVG